MKKITLGYTIGRFNPLHLGHVSMINPMVKDNDYSLIAFEFKTKDNFLLAPNYRIGNDQNNLGINFKYSF